MRLFLHKIVSTFTELDKTTTVFGDTGPPVLPLDPRMNVSKPVKHQLK